MGSIPALCNFFCKVLSSNPNFVMFFNLCFNFISLYCVFVVVVYRKCGVESTAMLDQFNLVSESRGREPSQGTVGVE